MLKAGVYRQMTSEPSSFGMSKSAPAAPDMEELKDKDTISIGGSDTDHSDDEFTRLKNVRQAERLSRSVQYYLNVQIFSRN